MLIPSEANKNHLLATSLSRRVNANSQHDASVVLPDTKLIKKGEC